VIEQGPHLSRCVKSSIKNPFRNRKSCNPAIKNINLFLWLPAQLAGIIGHDLETSSQRVLGLGLVELRVSGEQSIFSTLTNNFFIFDKSI